MTLGIVQYVSNTATNWGGNAEIGGSRVSGSFTPAATAKLYAFLWTETTPGTGLTLSVTDSLGNAVGSGWTTVLDSGLLSGGVGRARFAIWELDTGSSPSARTVTFSASETTGAIAYGIFAVTGNSPQIKSGQKQVDGAVGASITVGDFPVAATSGNLVVMAVGANKDTSSAPTTPTGFTVLFSVAGGGKYEAPAAFYRTDFTGVNAVFNNTGDSANISAGVLLEFEEAGPPPPILGLLAEDGKALLDESGRWLLADA